MLHVALWEPEIPPNTGNIARSCVATETALHLIGRLGFHLDDRNLKRAGMDYWPQVQLHHHTDQLAFETAFARFPHSGRIWCVESPALRTYTSVRYQPGDCLLFGNESSGLPASVLERHADRVVAIPMPGTAVRSLNLATSVGIVLYEALRQIHGW
jgi:tRNA (cytidine/uridine-2'-O-)-methyltransferase